jgi:hypothetical protein
MESYLRPIIASAEEVSILTRQKINQGPRYRPVISESEFKAFEESALDVMVEVTSALINIRSWPRIPDQDETPDVAPAAQRVDVVDLRSDDPAIGERLAAAFPDGPDFGGTMFIENELDLRDRIIAAGLNEEYSLSLHQKAAGLLGIPVLLHEINRIQSANPRIDGGTIASVIIRDLEDGTSRSERAEAIE